MRADLALNWMLRRCALGEGCPLKHPSAPVRKLAEVVTFKQAVLESCSRLECQEKLIAVLANECPNP